MDEDLGQIHRTAYRNVSFELIGEATATLIGIAFFVIITRCLGATDFGRFSFVQALMMFVAMGLDFGSTSHALREWARTSDSETRVRTLGDLIAFRTAMIMPLASSILGWTAWQERSLLVPMAVGLTITYLDALLDLLTTSYQAQNQFRTSNWIKIQDRVLTLGIGALGTWATGSLLGTYVCMLVTKVLLVAFLARSHRSRWQLPSMRAFSFHALVTTMRASHSLFFQSVAAMVFNRVDVLLIKGLLGLTPLGFYSSAYRMLEQMAVVPSLLVRSFYPSVVSSIAARSQHVQALYAQVTRLSMVAGTYASLMVYLVSDVLILTLFGEDFRPSIPILRLLAMSLLLKFAFLPAFTFLLASNRERAAMIGFVLAGVANIALNLWWIPLWGIEGSALATIAAELALTIWCIRCVDYEYRVTPTLSLVAFAGATALLWHWVQIHWFLEASLTSLAFVAFLFLARFTSVAELRSLLPNRKGAT